MSLSVLIVQPNARIAREIEAAALAVGLSPRVVSDGERAIDHFVQHPSAVVVVDLALPGRDGAATIESIRWAPHGPDAAIVVTGIDAAPARVERVADDANAAAMVLGVPSRASLMRALERAKHAVLKADRSDHGKATRRLSAVNVEEVEAYLAERQAGPDSQRHTPMVQQSDAAEAYAQELSTGGKFAPLATVGRSSRATPPPDEDPDVTRAAARPRKEPASSPSARSDLSSSSGSRERERPLLSSASVPRATHPISEPPEPRTLPPTDEHTAREGLAVERRAREAQELARLSGVLRDVSFPYLLSRLAEQRATGALVLESDALKNTTTGGSPKKVIFFRNGIPLHVDSNIYDETLGQVLIKTRAITQDQLRESLALVGEGAGRHGGVLVAMGALAPRDLREALEEQQRSRLFELFSWPSGTFSFTDELNPPTRTVTLEMALSDIVHHGVVHYTPRDIVFKAFDDRGGKFVIPEVRRLDPLSDRIPDDDAEFYSLLTGTQTLSSLLRDQRTFDRASRLLFAAECIGAIEIRDAPEFVNREHPSREIALPNLGAERLELARVAVLFRSGLFGQALNVTEGTDAARDALVAVETKANAWSGPGVEREIRTNALEILALLPRARRVLTSRFVAPVAEPSEASSGVSGVKTEGSGSASFSGHLERDAGEPSRDESRAHMDDSHARIEDDLEDETTTRGIKIEIGAKDWRPSLGRESAPALAPDRPLRVAPPSDPGGPIRATFAAEEAHESSTPPPPTRAEDASTPSTRSADFYESVIPPANESAELSPADKLAAERAAAEAEEEAAEALDDKVDNMLQAERYFRRAERALARDKPESAKKNFQRAVDLCPSEGEFVAHLGYVRLLLGDTEGEDAMEQLISGCSLSPQNARLHLLKARSLRSAGRDADARNAYSDALSADPDLKEALDGLRELTPPRV